MLYVTYINCDGVGSLQTIKNWLYKLNETPSGTKGKLLGATVWGGWMRRAQECRPQVVFVGCSEPLSATGDTGALAVDMETFWLVKPH